MTAPLTFLFTDLENSARLWEQFPGAMRPALARHDELLRETVETHRGRIVKTTGDGVHAVFESASDGVAAALAGQQALIAEPWSSETGPLRVRMGLHSGESQERDGDYYGPEVNRAARVMDIGHGGQILVSAVTAALVRNTLPSRVSLSDLGEHRLKGIAAVEQIFQVCHPALPSQFPPLKSLSVYKHNLPAQLSSFVCREKELADVKRLLSFPSPSGRGERKARSEGGEGRLLTLLGPGGTGKTRLMLQAAEEMVADYADGVWLVELAPLSDPSLMAERVAAVLKVQEQPNRKMRDTLADYLRHKELLLLLDNVEHIVQESAELAEHLLEHCPKLKILVTGREALFIGGETTLQIPSLSLPGRGAQAPEAIANSEAVQLFLARAQAVRPGFALTPAIAPVIAEIVRRLDGIPLALELAAARLRMLTVEQIAARLNDRFRLLTGGRRTALPRQQTLQALIEWSWNLLDDKERTLLRCLSVFSGGWTLEAAQAVCPSPRALEGRGGAPLDESDVFDYLDHLINKSLVTVQYPSAGEARYGMLESIRQYARDRLFEAGEAETLRDRHADYFAAFAADAGQHLSSSTELLWIHRLIPELDNLRSVLTWTQEDRPALALRICGHLFYYDTYWLTPGEVRFWLEPLIEKTRGLLEDAKAGASRGDFIRALIGLGWAYGMQGLYNLGVPTLEEAIRLARQAGESRLLAMGIVGKTFQTGVTMSKVTPQLLQEVEEAAAISRQNGYKAELFWALGVAAEYHILLGNHELGMKYYAEVIEIAREINMPRGNAGAFLLRALLADMQGNLDDAKKYRLLAIEEMESINNRFIADIARSTLAHIYRREGNLTEAEAHYRKTIVSWQERSHRSAVAHQLECFAFIAIARGQHAHAARLLGCAKETRARLNAASDDPQEIAEWAQAMERLAEAMGEAERDRVMAEGKTMNLDDAVALALKGRGT